MSNNVEDKKLLKDLLDIDEIIAEGHKNICIYFHMCPLSYQIIYNSLKMQLPHLTLNPNVFVTF